MNNDLQLPQATTGVKDPGSGTWQAVTVGSIFESCPDATPLVQGIYTHVPFCAHRCHYCDFFTVAGRGNEHEVFVDRLLREIEAVPGWIDEPVETIFVGGGTPTILPPGSLRRLLKGLATRFASTSTEFTVEANPETVTREVARALVEGGVNRVSLGAQSFDHQLLERLQRQHDPDNVARSLELLWEAGIKQVSLDLIFAIPGQQIEQWQADLEMAISLDPGHLSCYGLVYEPGTPLRGRLDRGEIEPVDEDTEALMYEWTLECLATAGYEHYEISNWARPGEACRHNLLYWQNHNWWPLGPSASGHVDGWRWRNLPRLGSYLEGSGLSGIRDLERLDEDGRTGERFMMGLRCLEGLAKAEVDSMLAGEGGTRRGPIMERHLADGLLQWKGDRLRLTRQGLLLANLVTADLLSPHPAPGTRTQP